MAFWLKVLFDTPEVLEKNLFRLRYGIAIDESTVNNDFMLLLLPSAPLQLPLTCYTFEYFIS